MERATASLPSVTRPVLTRSLARTLEETTGQDLLEYGLLAALISIFAIAAVTSVGRTINDVFWSLIGNGFSGL